MDSIERGLERRDVGGERRDAIEVRVETEKRRLVAGLQCPEHVPRRLPCVYRFRPHSHAAADVKKHRELDRPIGLCAEVENRPDLPGFGYDEILPLEVSNEAALSITNDGAH